MGLGDTVDISVFHHHITVVFIQIVKVHICHCHVQLFIVYQSTGADRTVFQKLDWDSVLFLELICNSWEKFAKTERGLIVAIMVIVGAMSGFLSNTGTAAVLIPVVIGIAAKSGYKRSRLLMPLVFAAAMGGNLSLIGAPGNMIAQSALEPLGLKFGFFEYAIVGLPILLVGILFYATIGFKILPDHDAVDTGDSIFDESQDFSGAPKWKKVLSLVILIVTLVGMIFEEEIGVKLCITGYVGVALLILTGVILEKA